MFTGIIRHTGTVRAITKKAHGMSLTIKADGNALHLQKGGSIAINGVCLTVTDIQDAAFSVDVVRETLSRTNLAFLKNGHAVHIELPLEVGERLDGHILEGHIDGMGVLLSISKRGIQTILRIKLPVGLSKYVVENGSIGIDGVSLTVKSIDGNIMSVALVPVTLENTTFAKRARGEQVNIEVERMGKYLEQQLKIRGRSHGR